MGAAVRFDDLHVGDEVFSVPKAVTREDVKAYADASGDQNPLHQDDAFAQSVGFPGIIAHGMFSMAHLAHALTAWLRDPSALMRFKVQFRAPVFMDETLVARGRVKALDPGSREATVEVWIEVEREGRRILPIKNSEAIVRLS